MQATLSQQSAISRLYERSQHFTSWDDMPIHYRRWQKGAGPAHRTILILHDHQEHAGYYQTLASALVTTDCQVYAWDARGCGRSSAHNNDRHFQTLVRDLDCFVQHLQQQEPRATSQIAVIGQGLGSAVAASWLNDYAPSPAAAVLSGLPLRIKSLGPMRSRALALLHRCQPQRQVGTYLKLKQVTSDRAEAALRRDDPFITPSLPLQLILSQRETMRRVANGPETLETPLLMLCAEQDRISDSRRCREFFDRVGSLNKTWKSFPGGDSAVLHGHHHKAAKRLIQQFLEQAFNEQAGQPKIYLGAGFGDAGQQPAQGASNPMPVHSFMLSRGARLARDIGFHAGQHLDYLLRNRPEGRTRLARHLDRHYLNQRRCRAVRERHELLGQLLTAAITERAATSQPLRILQLGGAPARCLRDVLQANDRLKIDATCLDPDHHATAAGRQANQALATDNLEFEHIDLMDQDSLADWPNDYPLLIADGMIEACDDSGSALRLLRAFKARLSMSGQLILSTYLPNGEHGRDGLEGWHPRPMSTVKRMLRLVGFEIERTEVEHEARYGLILARKRRPD